MNIFYELPQQKICHNSILSIGNFDGVHKGHKYLLEKCVKQAQEKKIPSVVFSFYNNPALFINNVGSYYITLPEEKIDLIKNLNVEICCFPIFDEKIMKISPEIFMEKIQFYFNPSKIIVGQNFNFGYKREGDYNSLQSFFGLDRVDVIKPVEYESERISSTRIRKLIYDGEVELAEKLLGYNFFIEGIVSEGNKIGAQLGIPTLNIHTEKSGKIVPKPGVYVTKTLLDGVLFDSITNIGGAPTLNFEDRNKIETHIFDNNLQKMYNKKIKIIFLKFLRDEVKFENVEMLKNTMLSDIIKAKKIISGDEGEK
ncbi:MAG: bifunctional riboflavin kinase/FAD synthetase [Candidatus Muiribacteriota bacterium]